MIIGKAQGFARQTSYLKENSPYYPDIFLTEEPSESPSGRTFVGTTLVRIERDGKWYTVHHVHRHYTEEADSHLAITTATRFILERIMREAHLTQNLYVITGKYEDIDTSQEPEADRLLRTLP